MTQHSGGSCGADGTANEPAHHAAAATAPSSVAVRGVLGRLMAMVAGAARTASTQAVAHDW